VLPRKAAAGAERGSLEPGHASLPGLAGRQLAAGTWRPVPAHNPISGSSGHDRPEGSALPCGLPQDRERRGVILPGRERSRVLALAVDQRAGHP
jgi:hypothetical protein